MMRRVGTRRNIKISRQGSTVFGWLVTENRKNCFLFNGNESFSGRKQTKALLYIIEITKKISVYQESRYKHKLRKTRT